MTEPEMSEEYDFMYDLEWLAVDQAGEVASLTTNCSSCAPKNVWNDDWHSAVGEAIANLPTSVRRVAEIRSRSEIDTLSLRHVILKRASQGLHWYDWRWSDQRRITGDYQRWLLSGTPLKEHELPDTLRDALVFLPIRFRDAPSLDERWLREVGMGIAAKPQVSPSLDEPWLREVGHGGRCEFRNSWLDRFRKLWPG